MNQVRLAPMLMLAFLIGGRAHAECTTCVEGDPAVEKELIALSALAPKDQLARVRASGTCVVIRDSGRKPPEQFFTWGKVEVPSGPLSEITRLPNLVGKTFCQGEHDVAKHCATIVLASDAPKSTLWHELLHVRQTERDPAWCADAKGRDQRAIRDKEWDVHRLLWDHRTKLGLGLEDDLTITAETIEEAELRQGFDAKAAEFVRTEKLRERLTELMGRYPKAIKPVKSIDGIAATPAGRKKLWPRLPVSVCTPEGANEKLKSALRDGVSAWNTAFAKPVFKLECPGSVSVHWITKDFAKVGDRTTCARTVTDANEETGELLSANLMFNAESFNWELPQMDLTTVTIHELGHSFGLAHDTLDTDTVMDTLPYASGVQRRKLGAYEKTAIGRAYFSSRAPLPRYLDRFLNDDLDAAVKELRAKKKRTAGDDYALGLLEKSLKHPTQAIAPLKRAAKDKANLRALYELGDAYWAANEINKATDTFAAVLEKNPDYYEALANLGTLALQINDRAAAKTLLERTLKVNPVHYVACYLLFQMSKEERHKECVKRYTSDPELLEGLR